MGQMIKRGQRLINDNEIEGEEEGRKVIYK